jgi:hypothetical protein
MLGQVDKNLSELIRKLSWIHKELEVAKEAGCSEEIVAWLEQRVQLVREEIVESDADLHA